MADMGGSGIGNTRYPYYYGPEGRLLLVDSALEAVGKGSTTIGIKTTTFALISSHIKPTKPLVEPCRENICNRWTCRCYWFWIHRRHTSVNR